MTERTLDLALFAADQPGVEMARFIAGRGDRIPLLVLDHQNFRGCNDAIVEAMANHADVVVFDDDERLRELLSKADIALLAWWPHIIKRDLLAIPRLGFLNCHPSLLPHNRGKHYNFWALVEEAPFGVSIHWVGERVDAGDVAFQAPVPTTWEDTGETLFHKARAAMVELFRANYDRIRAGDIPRIPQDLERGSFHKAAEIDAASRIDLDGTVRARDLLNLLRARTFQGYPGAWFADGGERYEVRVDIRKVEKP
jgi:methionyl-tRNA formyltransferase